MKNIIMSAMAAVIMIQLIPWFSILTMVEKIGAFIGIFPISIYFFAFFEDLAEKMAKRRRRRKRVAAKVKRIREGKVEWV